MMPIVIQLQSSVRCIPDGEILVESPAERSAQDVGDSAIHPARLLRAEDSWLRGVVFRDPHLNVLVQCSGVPVASAFDQIRQLCSRPLCVSALPGLLRLPEDEPASLLIGDVSTLTLLQQIELYDWLGRFRAAAQVISVTSVPLWPLVRAGRFFEGLFYRLNVVSLTAGHGSH
jgi:hypothetical protein